MIFIRLVSAVVLRRALYIIPFHLGLPVYIYTYNYIWRVDLFFLREERVNKTSSLVPTAGL